MKYLQLLTLYSEIKELLIEYDLKKQDVHPSSTTSQASVCWGEGGVSRGDRKLGEWEGCHRKWGRRGRGKWR